MYCSFSSSSFLFNPSMARLFGVFLICCLVLVCVDTKRGQRINIFKQARGDIAQIKPSADFAIFNALRRDSTKKWDYLKDPSGNNIVPYVIQGTYTSDELAIINGAMKRLEENVCVRFRPRTNEPDYIEFQNAYYEGCYTTVGRAPGKNVVMLEANDLATCIEHDIVIHEVMHSLGLWHEQMRYDRDSFIKIIWDNIPLSWSPFIGAQESTTYDINYDYRSVMHYPKDAFAKVPGMITMQTLDPAAQDIIGTQKDASPSDYKKLCSVYQCNQCMAKPITNQTATVPLTTTTATTTPTPTTRRRTTSTSSTTTTTTTTTKRPTTHTRRPPTTSTTTPTTTTTTTRPTTPPPPSPSKKCSDQFGPFCQQVLSVKWDACISWDSFMSINCCQTCKKLDKQNKKLDKQSQKSDIRLPKSHWELEPNNFAFDGWF